jgi:hypothetical protein
MPESPRWLISKDRDEEAFKLLVLMHGEGNPESPLVKAEYKEIRDTLHYERETQGNWKALIAPSKFGTKLLQAAALFTKLEF